MLLVVYKSTVDFDGIFWYVLVRVPYLTKYLTENDCRIFGD